MRLDKNQWVFVCDTENAPSETLLQQEHLRTRGLDLMTIDCANAPPNANVVCTQLPALPAFCNLQTRNCYPGVCDTEAHFEDLGEKQQ